MKLKVINLTIEAPAKTRKPTIHFSKSGTITLSTVLCQALEITADTKLEFFQDEDRPKDFYLVKSTSDVAYTLRAKKPGTHFIFNSVTLYKLIGEALKLEGSVSLPVSLKPLEVPDCPPLFALLTAAVKK